MISLAPPQLKVRLVPDENKGLVSSLTEIVVFKLYNFVLYPFKNRAVINESNMVTKNNCQYPRTLKK